MRIVVALAVLALALAGCGTAGTEEEPRLRAVATSAPELPPLPPMRPRAVEPVAGAGVAGSSGAVARAPVGPAPRAAASETERGDVAAAPAAVDGGIAHATAMANGIALAPLDAPAAVKRIVAAGNIIARTPYKWGGGHGRWRDDGYDCSGSVSFALHFAGLLDGPRNSTGLMDYGDAGPGRWVTVYANDGHVFLEVAGIRFDTSGARRTGSRWQSELRGDDGGRFVARHPPGL